MYLLLSIVVMFVACSNSLISRRLSRMIRKGNTCISSSDMNICSNRFHKCTYSILNEFQRKQRRHCLYFAPSGIKGNSIGTSGSTCSRADLNPQTHPYPYRHYRASSVSSIDFSGSIYDHELKLPSQPTFGDLYVAAIEWLTVVCRTEKGQQAEIDGSRKDNEKVEGTIEDIEDSVRHLLCHAGKIGYRYSDFNANKETLVNPRIVDQMKLMLHQRANRVPVQYIVGNWDFFGMTLYCEPPILIPRPETEELVELVLNTNILQSKLSNSISIQQQQQQQQQQQDAVVSGVVRILDVGAGTGAIGLALLTQLISATSPATSSSFIQSGSSSSSNIYGSGNASSMVEVIALDINAAAVELATRNANFVLNSNNMTNASSSIRTSGSSSSDGGDGDGDGAGVTSMYTCYHQDFVGFVTEHVANIHHSYINSERFTGKPLPPPRRRSSFDVIVSNPPYIPSHVVTQLQPEVRLYEDAQALDGGVDGLDIIRDLIALSGILFLDKQQQHQEQQQQQQQHKLQKQQKQEKRRSWNQEQNQSELLGELWLEVSEEHPALIQAWMQSSDFLIYCQRRQENVASAASHATINTTTTTNNYSDSSSILNSISQPISQTSWPEATFVEGLRDLSGNPRFVRIAYKSKY